MACKSQIHFKIKTSVNLGVTFDVPNKFSQLHLANEENFKRDSLDVILILFTLGKYTVTFHISYHYLFFFLGLAKLQKKMKMCSCQRRLYDHHPAS